MNAERHTALVAWTKPGANYAPPFLRDFAVIDPP
jgi:hypothetical protein